MSSSWWAHKLGNPQPAQRPPTPPVVYQQPAHPAPAPSHHAPAPSPHHGSHHGLLDPSKAPTEQIGMGDAIKLWKGGEAWQRDGHVTCPSCGSHLFFSNTKTRINGAPAAPRCYSCGFNGKFEQADQTNWMT